MKRQFCFYWPISLMAFLWLFALSGCTLTSKEPERKPAAGRVLEYGTLKPIEGAVVTLYECEGEVLGNFSCHAIDSTSSSTDGQYAFSQTGFLTNARKADYFTDDYTEAHVLFGSEEKSDITLPPYAWLKVTIRNESGAYAISSSALNEINPRILLPLGTDSTIVKLLKGNKPYKFIYGVWLQENVPGETKSIDVLPIGHDTTAITITY